MLIRSIQTRIQRCDGRRICECWWITLLCLCICVRARVLLASRSESANICVYIMCACVLPFCFRSVNYTNYKRNHIVAVKKWKQWIVCIYKRLLHILFITRKHTSPVNEHATSHHPIPPQDPTFQFVSMHDTDGSLFVQLDVANTHLSSWVNGAYGYNYVTHGYCVHEISAHTLLQTRTACKNRPGYSMSAYVEGL